MRTLSMIAVVSALLLVVGCRHSPESKAGLVVGWISYQLDLSQDQELKLGDIKNTVLAAREDAVARQISQKAQLVDLIRSDEISEAQLLELYRQHQAFVESRLPELLNDIAVLHRSLSPAQKEIIVERFEKHLDKQQLSFSESDLPNLFGSISAL